MAQRPNPFTSERLIYRAVQDDDIALVDAIQNDPWAFGNSSFAVMKPQTAHELQQQKENLASKSLLGVIICLPPPADGERGEANDQSATQAKPTPTPIGAISLHAVAYMHNRESSIAIDILTDYRGKGYGSEAINWILQWGFQVAGLHRVTIEAFSYNDGACRLYERLGFVPEGRKRKSVWFNGDWHDHLIFGMLEDEWRAKTAAKKF